MCRRCERWNLTPFEDRWEAIEQCERLYRDTRRRFATDQIGLARLPEGLDLVRIGEPLRPEFAAWRYGDQFGRRRRRAIATYTGLSALGIGLMFSHAFFGIAGSVMSMGQSYLTTYQYRRRRAMLDLPGAAIAVSSVQVGNAEITPESTSANLTLRIQPRVAGWLTPRPAGPWQEITGSAAIAAARRILPILNADGGNAATVADAARRLDQSDHPDNRFGGLAMIAAARKYGRRLGDLPADLRLALEMAVNEDSERVWLAGELLDLEAEWRRAEELAAIADHLAAEDLDRQLTQLKDRRPG